MGILSPAGLGPIRQLGYVVQDLDDAIAQWQNRLAVGPWTIMRNITLDCVYRAQPSQPQIDIALAYRGEQQIELIQQRNDAPSPYRPWIEQGRFGLHHIAFLCPDIEQDIATLQGHGLNLACDIRMPGPGGGRYVYFDSPVPGEDSFIELLEATTMMRTLFAEGIAEAQRSQGEGPTLDLNLGPALAVMRGLRRLLSRTHKHG